MTKRLKCDGQTNSQDGRLYKLEIEAHTEKNFADTLTSNFYPEFT